jgi:hypothetical protein
VSHKKTRGRLRHIGERCQAAAPDLLPLDCF